MLVFKYYKLALFGLFLIAFNGVEAKKNEKFEKVIEKSFNVQDGYTLDVSNKYGDIRIENWKSDKIQIKVIITVTADNEKAANKSFDRIGVGFSESDNTVFAKTEIASESNWKSVMSWNSKTKFQIDYFVKMPEYIELDLANKYGDIHLGDIKEQADITLKYGDLKAVNFCKKLELYLAYGDMKVENMDHANLVVKYSDAFIGGANAIELNADYSDIKLETCGSIDLDMDYSDLKAEEIKDIIGDMDYSDIKLERLMQGVEIDMDYSDLYLDFVSSSFKRLMLDGDYSDISANLEDNSGFEIRFNGSYADLVTSSGFNNGVSRDKSGTKLKATGKVGDGSGFIEAKLTYGSLKIH